MITIKFHRPRLSSSNIHTLAIAYPFDVIIMNPNVENNNNIKRVVLVSIDDITKNTWNYRSIIEFEKVLFKFLLESDKIKLQNIESLLEGNIEDLVIPTQRERIYDPSKLNDPQNFVINFSDVKHLNKIDF